LRAQQLSASGVFEVTTPEGNAANGLTSDWSAITPLPWVINVTQEAAAAGGSDTEADTSLRARTQLSPESWSTAGPAGAYKYWALSADERIVDINVSSPTPGIVQIVVLADSETGEADAAMLERITAILNDEEKRPLTDTVNVLSATPQPYLIGVHLTIEAGVSSDPVLVEAKSSLERLSAEKRKIHAEIPLSAIIAAAHVEGVRKVIVSAPTEDISCTATEAPYCTGITITWSIVSD
ncbi:MAG: baseplate J/gp47 family protein, partial [Cloacibacillus sp.]